MMVAPIITQGYGTTAAAVVAQGYGVATPARAFPTKFEVAARPRAATVDPTRTRVQER